MAKSGKDHNCAINFFLEILGSKWKPLIIWNLRTRPLRFSELQKKMNNLNSNTLTTHLRELEELKLISRKVYPEVPPRVVYSLTEYAEALYPVYEAMLAWSEYYTDHEGIERKKCTNE